MICPSGKTLGLMSGRRKEKERLLVTLFGDEDQKVHELGVKEEGLGVRRGKIIKGITCQL